VAVEVEAMSNSSLLDRFAALDSAAVSDALDQLGLPPGVGGVRPVWGPAAVVGFAVTVGLEPRAEGPAGAHIATTAVENADDRSVIVVAIDGGVRDAAEIEGLGFPVFSRNNSILGTRKDFRGVLGRPVTVGGVTVHIGDLVVGDVDGVVTLPASDTERILDRAGARVAHENELMKQLREGRSTLDLYNNFEAAGR
jgi:regulator of RNase E activity RraA